MTSSEVRRQRILMLVAQSHEPVTLARRTEVLDIPKSSAHGVVKDLVAESFTQPAADRGYWMGLKAFKVGATHPAATDAVGAVRPVLQDLTQSLLVTSQFAILDGVDVVHRCQEDPLSVGVRLAGSVGARLPSHLTAVGRACLSSISDVTEHLDLSRCGTRTQPLSEPELRQLITRCMRDGYSVTDGDAAAGFRCVAAPVRDTRRCCGAIGVGFVRGTRPEDDHIIGLVKSRGHDGDANFEPGADPVTVIPRPPWREPCRALKPGQKAATADGAFASNEPPLKPVPLNGLSCGMPPGGFTAIRTRCQIISLGCQETMLTRFWSRVAQPNFFTCLPPRTRHRVRPSRKQIPRTARTSSW